MSPIRQPGQNPDVLIVEDSATQRELLRHALEQHGYHVTAAASGPEALQKLQGSTPAVVISDIIMPGLDGFELCRRIKSDEQRRSMAVVLLTALSDPKDLIKGLQCGADHFIVKPYHESDLLRRLEYIRSNTTLPRSANAGEALEIRYGGEPYAIKAHPRQILDLLLSTYEAAVHKNAELEKAREQLKAANAVLEQRVRERTARLEEANQSLESFCYSIAHDLRSPLRAIQGYTAILLEEYGRVYNDEARETSNRVIAAARHMDQLIQDLLAYGQISQVELPTSKVSLEQELDTVLEQLSREVAQRKAQIEIRRPLPPVQANSVVLEQVLTNLLTNALKFTRDQVPPRVQIWAESANAHAVRLHVQDNGIGFDPAHAKRIFGVFQRLHDPRKYPGTGIGLVIVRKGVERMGGQVGVESRPNQGARFWIELPKPGE